MASQRQLDMKAKEGDEKMKEGDSLSTRSLFRWKPDWAGAAPVYEQAAVAYKNAKQPEKAKVAHMKAADAYFKSDSLFLAGKNIELAAQLARDIGQAPEAVELYNKAREYYELKGMNDKAAEALVKGAKIAETCDSEQALALYRQAIELLIGCGRDAFAMDAFKGAVAVLVRLEKFLDAVEMLRRQAVVMERLGQGAQAYKVYLSQVVLLLHVGDFVGAEKAFQDALQAGSFFHSTEGKAANRLLDAFEHRDEAELKKVVMLQTFGFLEAPVAKIARALSIPLDMVTSGPKMEVLNQETLDRLEQEKRQQEIAAAAAAAGVGAFAPLDAQAAVDGALAGGLERLVVGPVTRMPDVTPPQRPGPRPATEREALDRAALFSLPSAPARAAPAAPGPAPAAVSPGDDGVDSARADGGGGGDTHVDVTDLGAPDLPPVRTPPDSTSAPAADPAAAPAPPAAPAASTAPSDAGGGDFDFT